MAFAKLSGFVRQISHTYYLSKYHQKRILNQDDVDDLTQNVYLSFAQQYHNIEEPEKWLRRVLFLNFVKWYKSNKNKSHSSLKENIPAPDNFSESSDMIDSESALSVLNTLSEEKQEIVRLRFWGDLKFNEIAEKLNKNEAAVKKMFYRTLLELKDKLK
ncbi:MAG: RNA polymerase sigma factor [Ignavibacteriaceae bacterium]|nr:RNA polymerase sigma factor [Ignavibacteriaceae bacterium]